MKIAIIGTGALGSSLAINYAANKKKVNIWNRTAINVSKLSDLNNRTNQKRPFINFLKYCNIKNSVEEVVQGSTTILLCINAQSVHIFLRKYSHFLQTKTVVFCSKGIDTKSLLLQTEIGEKFLEQNQLAVLTGPGFSADIISQRPIALTLACLNKKTGKTIQDLLSTPSIRTYLSSDIIGAQIGGSLKNVIAIACGITEARGLGDSAKIAVMTRGFNEIKKIGLALGCELETLIGLSGLGDLALTCTSTQSRNLNYGKNIASKKPTIHQYTVEGKYTATAACKIADKFDLDIPIIRSVDQIIRGIKGIDFLIESLLSRPLRTEKDP